MNQKTFSFCRATFLLASGLLAGVVTTSNATNWTGASLDSPSWGDTNNWDTLLFPGPEDIVAFDGTGSTNELGAVNNVITSNTTVTAITYLAPVSLITPTTNYHTTLISPGVTLNLDRGENSGSLLYVGDVTDPLNQDNQYYYTITGSGGSLVAGDLEAPKSNQGLQVTATQRSATNHIGSLDLSGLDNFSLAGGYFWVGINGGVNSIPTDRPAGRVSLAKTNLIIMVGEAYDDLNFGSFRVGESRANTPNQASVLELGKENSIYTPWLKIGGARTGTTATSGGLMHFRSGLDHPTLKLRGSDGVSRLGTMRISDNSWSSSGSSIGSRGVVDLTGGTVDALVDTLFVGRGPSGNNTTAAGRTAGANGVLTWTEGTIDVNTLFLGYQYGNNLSTNSGTVNVQGPNAKLIAGSVILGRDAGANAGGGIGALNIDSGTVEILTYLNEGLNGANVSSTITITNNGTLNLQPEGSSLPAVASFDTLNFSSGTVTNGTLALTNINVYPPSTAFIVSSNSVVNPGLLESTETLFVNGGLALSGGSLSFDVADAGTFDRVEVSGELNLSEGGSVQINPLGPISAGSYPLMTYGSLSGAGSLQVSGPLAESRYTVSFDTTAPNVTMNINGAAANLSWSGGNNNNAWDIKTTANWNSGSEQFYTYDVVNFGDEGLATPSVNLVGTLLPLGVNISGSKDYTFAGSGKISGTSGLTLNSSSTLTILTTNDYSGDTTINSGTLVLGDGATAQGSLGTGQVINYSTLVLNPADSQTNANVISGTGNVVKRGPGLTRLAGASTFTGAVTVEEGTLQAGNNSAFGDASLSGGYVTVLSGATLDIAGSALGTKPIIASGSGVNGQGAIFNSGSAQFLRDVQLDGDTVIGGLNGITIASSSATSTDPGLTAYGHKLTKVSTNHLKIQCLRDAPWNLDLGEVDVQGGMLSFYDNLNLGSQTSAPINVRSNAILGIANKSAFPLTKTYVLDSGACLYGLGADSLVDGSMTLNGKVVVDMANAMSLTVNCPITGAGSLVKGIGVHPQTVDSTGTGTLILTSGNTFNGDLRIETGTVVLTNSASVNQAPAIVLAGGTLDVAGRSDATLTLVAGQELNGSGNITGSLVSPTGTSVSVGENSIGVVNITGGATLAGTTTIELSKSGATLSNDQLNVAGSLQLGGTLNVTFSGDELATGDKFTLFTAGTLAGSFATVNLPVINGVVLTNKTAIDGTIEVLSAAPPTPPTIGNFQVLADGSFQVQLSGASGSGYTVRSSVDVSLPIDQWTVLTNGVFGDAPLNFIDSDATNNPQRFYIITTP